MVDKRREDKENIGDISQNSITRSMPQINNMEELYEALQRHGYVLPKLSC